MDEFSLNEWLSEDSSVVPTEPVEVIKPTLTVGAVSVLNFCEQVYWESGLLPTPEACSEELGINSRTVGQYYKDEVFQQQLASRGIDPTQLVYPGKLIQQSKALSPKQIVCANLMLNLHDKRSEREKLALIQVSSQQYHAWLRQPQFVEFLRKRGEALFSSSDYLAYKSLVTNVKAGDNKSLELFFRMRGIYNPSIDVNINIESVLLRVVEVISTHVKDPLIINQIAAALDEIIDAEVA